MVTLWLRKCAALSVMPVLVLVAVAVCTQPIALATAIEVLGMSLPGSSFSQLSPTSKRILKQLAACRCENAENVAEAVWHL